MWIIASFKTPGFRFRMMFSQLCLLVMYVFLVGSVVGRPVFMFRGAGRGRGRDRGRCGGGRCRGRRGRYGRPGR